MELHGPPASEKIVAVVSAGLLRPRWRRYVQELQHGIRRQYKFQLGSAGQYRGRQVHLGKSVHGGGRLAKQLLPDGQPTDKSLLLSLELVGQQQRSGWLDPEFKP